MFTGLQGIAHKSAGAAVRTIPVGGVKAAALAASLVFSALLTAVAWRTPDLHWLAWISFLPLFVVVRSLGCLIPGGLPSMAVLAGGLWGGCLYLFCSAGPAPAIAPSVWLLALLIVIPAVYVGLAARHGATAVSAMTGGRTTRKRHCSQSSGTRPGRTTVFNLLTLALGWTLIEAVLHLHNQSSPHEGLLTGSQAEGLQLHWLARLLGYVCTAFLVACVNASLVGILSGARLRFPAYRSSAGSPNAVGWLPSQVVLAIQSWTLRQAYPRAPPIPVAVPS